MMLDELTERCNLETEHRQTLCNWLALVPGWVLGVFNVGNGGTLC